MKYGNIVYKRITCYIWIWTFYMETMDNQFALLQFENFKVNQKNKLQKDDAQMEFLRRRKQKQLSTKKNDFFSIFFPFRIGAIGFMWMKSERSQISIQHIKLSLFAIVGCSLIGFDVQNNLSNLVRLVSGNSCNQPFNRSSNRSVSLTSSQK